MKAYGYVVPESAEKAALRAMKNKGGFTSRMVETVLIKAGVPYSIPYYPVSHTLLAYRVADRLLKREKKKGAIGFSKTERIWYPN